MKLVVNRAFISKTIFLLFMIILFLGVRDCVNAGEMRMDNVTINGQLGIGAVEAGKYFEICANVDGYSYSGKGKGNIYAVLSFRSESIADEIHRVIYLGGTDSSQKPKDIKNCGYLLAPKIPGEYTILYNPKPLFTAEPLARSPIINAVLLNDNRSIQIVTEHMNNYQHSKELATITVERPSRLTRKKIATHMRVNGQLASDKPVIKSGFSKNPVTFSWDVSGEAIEVEHRYRLFPQEEWSSWSKENSVQYFFIMPGKNTFEVSSRYKTKSKWLPGSRTDYRFVLKNAFVAGPENSIISKASHVNPTDKEEKISLDDIYNGSRALLIGVSNYSSPTFSFLPYVKKDIKTMEDVLGSLGFQVEKLNKVGSYDDIMAALENFVRNAKANERLIVYFSLHGFHDPVVKSRAFIAPHDCDPDSGNINCISLSRIKVFVEKAESAGVKHILVILDGCSAGLGVMHKNGQREYFELPIATKEGSHMIIAGLPNQEVLMDHELEMSYFTHFLAKGLSGKADYTKEGIISLTELLLFVRVNVAKESIGKQTPMLSRISGSGEMIFKVSSER